MKGVVASNGKCELRHNLPVPTVSGKEILIKVHYTALNRADTMQAVGKYPPPPGVTEVLGLEATGEVVKTGPDCKKFKEGDRVMALLAGGGYAEFVAVDERQAMEIPNGISFRHAAAIPETWLTAYQLLFFVAQVKSSDTVLIHAAGSGVGTAAIQLCSKIVGARVIATAGSQEKLEKAKELGATKCINRKTGPWLDSVLEATEGKGVSVILDCIGYPYVPQNLKAVAPDGRWVLYGLMGGPSNEIDLQVNLRSILLKRVQLRASTLRSRSVGKAKYIWHFLAPKLTHSLFTKSIRKILYLSSAKMLINFCPKVH
mmetsp:Transcript_4030/g.4937  ORF Transcript_4030/g.4937 Transcript_4030/m.4937 type:complete len:315 (+) Transcript_4030:64-1008(+)